MKALQTFSNEYLARCFDMSHDETAQFLGDFRRLHGAKQLNQKSISKLTSIKVPEELLTA